MGSASALDSKVGKSLQHRIHTGSGLATAHESASSRGKSVHRHSMSSSVSCVILTRKLFSVPPCVCASASRKWRGIVVCPCVENALSTNASSEGRGISWRSHTHRRCGPCRSTELVRTVSRRKRGSAASSSKSAGRRRKIPEPRNSVSRACRFGSDARMSGIAALGAPLRLSTRRRGNCERTDIRIVAGTPAQRCR